MRPVAFLLAVLAGCGLSPWQDPGQAPPPACEIGVARVDSAGPPRAVTISVDIASSCSGDEWSLEYRLLSSDLVTTSRTDKPCGSLTHVDVPDLAGFKVVGWLSNSAGQRVECRVR